MEREPFLSENERGSEFRALVELYQEKVRNTCYRYVHNSEDADDLTQEVFIQVHESLPYFREQSEISSWIYRIAVNKALDFIRRQKRKKRFAQVTSLFGSEEAKEGIVPAASSNPHQELEQREQKQILKRAIDSLPENQKTAIILSKYEGFSNKEIASIMSLSVSAVEALLHRAKKSLHSQLYHYFEERV
jgi:RNA polymerase sigma-70 factor, ECF subfamily